VLVANQRQDEYFISKDPNKPTVRMASDAVESSKPMRSEISRLAGTSRVDFQQVMNAVESSKPMRSEISRLAGTSKVDFQQVMSPALAHRLFSLGGSFSSGVEKLAIQALQS